MQNSTNSSHFFDDMESDSEQQDGSLSSADFDCLSGNRGILQPERSRHSVPLVDLDQMSTSSQATDLHLLDAPNPPTQEYSNNISSNLASSSIGFISTPVEPNISSTLHQHISLPSHYPPSHVAQPQNRSPRQSTQNRSPRSSHTRPMPNNNQTVPREADNWRSRESELSSSTDSSNEAPTPRTPPTEDSTDTVKRKRRTAALILISLVVLLTGLWDMYDVPRYCLPEDIASIGEYPEYDAPDGTVILRSSKFSLNEDLILTLDLRNTGKPLSSPSVKIVYYNPRDKRAGEKLVEVTFHLRDCQCSLNTGTKTIHLSIPFPIESALQMAMDGKPQLEIVIEGDNRVVMYEKIPLPPEILFGESWLKHLAGRVCRIIVFGEQGSAKSTAINDFLNMFQGLYSKLNFVPPPIGIQDAGTVGVVRVEIPEPHDSLLDSSIIFYDTEGAQQGKFLMSEDLHGIIQNPPKDMYLKRRSVTVEEDPIILPVLKKKIITLVDNSTVEIEQLVEAKDKKKKNTRKITPREFSLFPPSEIPENNEESIDFLLYTVNSNSLRTNEDGETVIDADTRASYTTVARAVSKYNEEHPSRPIQPIILITFGNIRASSLRTWCKDREAQTSLAHLVNLNLGDDPNPTMIYQTSHASIDDADRVFVLQSMAQLVHKMRSYIPPARVIPETGIISFLTKLKRSIFRVQTLDLIRYLHNTALWFLGCFYVI